MDAAALVVAVYSVAVFALGMGSSRTRPFFGVPHGTVLRLRHRHSAHPRPIQAPPNGAESRRGGGNFPAKGGTYPSLVVVRVVDIVGIVFVKIISKVDQESTGVV